MYELALFAGAGGGILGGHLLGWRTIAACEIEPYPRAVLLHNQKLGNLPHFPIWDDIRTFDGTPFRGIVDIVTGGFPCQDISCAGKGTGITGARSGLWSEMHRIIREVRPRYAFMENSPMLTSRGLGRVLGDLAEIGYHAAWCVLGAADCGAPHRRDRIWILAVRHTDRDHETTQQEISGWKQTPQSCRSSRNGARQESPAETDCGQRDLLPHPQLHRAGRWQQEPPIAQSEIGTPTSHADSDRLQRPECRLEHDWTEEPSGSCSHRLESRPSLDWDSNCMHEQTLGKICGEQTPHPGRVCRDVPHSLQQRQGGQQCCKEMEATPQSCPNGKERDLSDTTGIGLQASQRQPADLPAQSKHRTPDRTPGNGQNTHAPHTHLPGRQEQRSAEPAAAQLKTTQRSSWWSFEPRVGRVAHGVASRVDRLKSLGNGQVPLVAATAFQLLKQRLDNIQP